MCQQPAVRRLPRALCSRSFREPGKILQNQRIVCDDDPRVEPPVDQDPRGFWVCPSESSCRARAPMRGEQSLPSAAIRYAVAFLPESMKWAWERKSTSTARTPSRRSVAREPSEGMKPRIGPLRRCTSRNRPGRSGTACLGAGARGRRQAASFVVVDGTRVLPALHSCPGRGPMHGRYPILVLREVLAPGRVAPAVELAGGGKRDSPGMSSPSQPVRIRSGRP